MTAKMGQHPKMAAVPYITTIIVSVDLK